MTGLSTPDGNLKKSKSNNNEIVRMSGKNDDIIKELEDYVNEKKITSKYLDDISDFDGHNGSGQLNTQAIK